MGKTLALFQGQILFFSLLGNLSIEVFSSLVWHSVGVVLIHIPHTYALDRARLSNGLCGSALGLGRV